MKNYYYKKGAKKIWSEDIPENAYVCVGISDISDKGKLMIAIWENGTGLTPVFDKEKNPVVMLDHFGKTFRKGEWVYE